MWSECFAPAVICGCDDHVCSWENDETQVCRTACTITEFLILAKALQQVEQLVIDTSDSSSESATIVMELGV